MTPIDHPARRPEQTTWLAHAWRALAPERRLAALTSLGLFASMFLRWYSKTDTVVVHGAARSTETSLSAFQAFSFVEAAVLLVSAGVLAMLFARADGRVFRLPGGDGLVVMIAGGWAALLIFYRLLDKPALEGNERYTATVGVEWGIFIALLLAIGLLYAGGRMRALERPEPPLRRPRGADPRPPPDPRPPADPDTTVVTPVRARRRDSAPVAAHERGPVGEPGPARESGRAPESAAAPERGRYPPAPPGQLSFEDPPSRAE